MKSEYRSRAGLNQAITADDPKYGFKAADYHFSVTVCESAFFIVCSESYQIDNGFITVAGNYFWTKITR
jgi:hypothetical protein